MDPEETYWDLLILQVTNKPACTISEECDHQGNGPEELGEDYLLPEDVPVSC